MDGPPQSADSQPVTPIGRLIIEQMQREGLSYRMVEKRAAAQGRKISHNSVSQYALKPMIEFPTPDKWFALAAGLGVPVTVVADAMLETFGIRRSGQPVGPWGIVTAKYGELSEDNKRRVEEMAEAALRAVR